MPRIIASYLFLLILTCAYSQRIDSLRLVSGVVYDGQFNPVPYTHVIGLASNSTDVTDTLGIFHLYITDPDTLLLLNIAYFDTLVPVMGDEDFLSIHLRDRYYNIREVKIFDWGTSYSDFKDAVVNMPVEKPLGETLGLPRQDPDYIPFDMDESFIKSAKFLIHSPLSYIYYNLSRKQKSARKVYRLEKDHDKIELFQSYLSPEELKSLTGLEGEALQDFIIFLNINMKCDYNCTEMEIISEILRLHKIFIEVKNTGQQR